MIAACWVNTSPSITTGHRFRALWMVYLDKYYFGRNPTDLILVNYRNLHQQDTNYFGGYTTFMNAYRDQHPNDSVDGQVGGNIKTTFANPAAGMYLPTCKAKPYR
jgi:hypothetical protein